MNQAKPQMSRADSTQNQWTEKETEKNAFRVKSKDEQGLATGKGTHLAH